ncbi:polysaccharide deacetylase family protein [Aneurinibacillus terranovensis]|uniref:polysaccharide deacetylase family protein n=1 Tax=Aneurinibacillus terranovensis TaxID=278991 RepID=UPI0003F7CBCB|nr:polysaccharide deacetylase family protein [Aneurinibacillus terranovensis]
MIIAITAMTGTTTWKGIHPLLTLLLMIVAAYTIIPAVLTRIFGWSVLKKGRKDQGIAWTFDDGPDSSYTTHLLDVLKKYRVKATFFILGAKAEKHPDLILRMHKEGHLIGIHNYVHRSNWFMTPWSTWRQIKHSAEIVERITGVKPIHYRPPWGLINIFDFILLHKRFHIVLWSVMVGDWSRKVSREKIKQRLLKKISNGAIITLHDCGETFGADEGAPRHMIGALEDVLKETANRGYTWARIDEMTSNNPTYHPFKNQRKHPFIH